MNAQSFFFFSIFWFASLSHSKFHLSVSARLFKMSNVTPFYYPNKNKI